MRFKDKVVLVTGGNSGIGRGMVHRLIEEGGDKVEWLISEADRAPMQIV